MRQNKMGLTLASVLFFMRAAYAFDPSSLLHLDTWAFSKEDQAKLNAGHSAELGPGIIAAIAEATGNLPIGTLLEFRAVDLNADGICEIIAAVDVSGRGLVRELAVISRNGGAYYYDTIPAYGGEIALWAADDKQMLVAMQPAYDLSRTDPLITYPELFSWTGIKCEDVSRRARPYYEAIFLPQIKSLMAETESADRSITTEDRQREILRVASINRAAVTVNSFFDAPLISKAEIGVLKGLLESLGTPNEDNLDGRVGPLLRDAKAEAEAEISRLTDLGD